MKLLVALLLWITCAQAAPIELRHPNASRLWLSGDGSTLLSRAYVIGAPDQLRMWSLAGGKSIDLKRLVKGQTPYIINLAQDGRKLLFSRNRAEGRNSLMSYEIWTFDGTALHQTVKWSAPEKNNVLAARFEGQVCWMLTTEAIETRTLTGRMVRRTPLNAKIETGASALSSDGKWALANLKSQSRGALFDARSGRLHHVLQREGVSSVSENSGYISEANFSPDGCFVINSYEFVGGWLGDDVGRYYQGQMNDVWTAKDGALICSLDSAKLCFLDDGRHFFAGFGLWDVRGPKKVGQFNSPWMQESQLPPREIRNTQISSNGLIWALLDAEGNISIQAGDISSAG